MADPVDTTIADEITSIVNREIREASRDREYLDLSGGDGDGDPYGALEAEITLAREALDQASARVARLKVHRHEWNEEYLCILCGADGRA